MSKQTRFSWTIGAIGLAAIGLIAGSLASRNPLPPATAAACDPSYPSVCIPSPPPDLNCPRIPHRRFKVLQPDPHHFDDDRDGIGCEGK